MAISNIQTFDKCLEYYNLVADTEYTAALTVSGQVNAAIVFHASERHTTNPALDKVSFGNVVATHRHIINAGNSACSGIYFIPDLIGRDDDTLRVNCLEDHNGLSYVSVLLFDAIDPTYWSGGTASCSTCSAGSLTIDLATYPDPEQGVLGATTWGGYDGSAVVENGYTQFSTHAIAGDGFAAAYKVMSSTADDISWNDRSFWNSISGIYVYEASADYDITPDPASLVVTVPDPTVSGVTDILHHDYPTTALKVTVPEPLVDIRFPRSLPLVGTDLWTPGRVEEPSGLTTPMLSHDDVEPVWVEAPTGSGSTALDDLTDVTITTPSDDQFLRHDGAGWVNETVSIPATASDLTDIDTDKSKTPADGDVLTFDGTHWNAEAASGGASALDDLSDVDTDKSKTPADGDVLTFDGTHWNAEAATGGGASAIDDLTDVDTDKSKTPADGDVLTYDGTHWNAEVASAGASADTVDYRGWALIEETVETSGNITVTATGAGRDTVISLPSRTYDGNTEYILTFSSLGLYFPDAGNAYMGIWLQEGSTDVVRLAAAYEASDDYATDIYSPLYTEHRFTPSAGTYAITIAAVTNSGTGYVLGYSAGSQPSMRVALYEERSHSIAAGQRLELSYVELTSDINVTGTTEGTATTIVTSGSITVDGSTPIMVEFSTARVDLTSVSGLEGIIWLLYEDSTLLGRPAVYYENGNTYNPMFLSQRITPDAGTHTYTIKAYDATSASALVRAASGGTGDELPSYIRVTRANPIVDSLATSMPQSVIGAAVTADTTKNISNTTHTTFNELGTTIFDTSGFKVSGSDDRLVVPAGMAGTYFAQCRLGWDGNATGERMMRLFANIDGVDVEIDRQRNDAHGYLGQQCGAMVELNAGDYIYFQLWQNSSGTRTVPESADRQRCRLELYKVGSGNSGRSTGVSVQRTTTQSVSNATWTDASFDTEVLDTDGFWDSGSPTTITIPADMAGTYLLRGQAEVPSQSASTYCQLAAYHNSTDYYVLSRHGGSTPYPNRLTGSHVLELSGGDTLTLGMYQNSGGALSFGGTSTTKYIWFSLTRLDNAPNETVYIQNTEPNDTSALWVDTSTDQEGTAFPLDAAVGDRFYRTDLLAWYIKNNDVDAAWVTEELFAMSGTAFDISSTTYVGGIGLDEAGDGLWLEYMDVGAAVRTTHNSSNYWNLRIDSIDQDGSGGGVHESHLTVSTHSTLCAGVDNFTGSTQTIEDFVDPANAGGVGLLAQKNSSPGNLRAFFTIYYRKVAS